MTSSIETALTELSANLRRMEQRHQATGYKFDRLYGLIDAAREELAGLTADTARYRALKANARTGSLGFGESWISAEDVPMELDNFMDSLRIPGGQS